MERVPSILGSLPRLGRLLVAVLAFALIALPGESAAAPGPIYKCFDRDLGLVPHTPVVDAYISRVDVRPAVVRTRTKEAELAAAQGR